MRSISGLVPGRVWVMKSPGVAERHLDVVCGTREQRTLGKPSDASSLAYGWSPSRTGHRRGDTAHRSVPSLPASPAGCRHRRSRCCACLRPPNGSLQPGSEIHSNGVGAVDRHVEAEPTALGVNVEVGHHLRIAPDRPAGLQRERLVDGQVVTKATADRRAPEPGGVRSHRVDHHVGPVFVVLAEVAVDVVHQHQHDHGPPGSVPADPQAAVVDHPLGGFGVHREHGHVLIRLADQHRHGEHGAGDGVLRSSHHDN